MPGEIPAVHRGRLPAGHCPLKQPKRNRWRLYIYGEYDTWGACAPTPMPHVDALKMVLKGAPHSTRIKHFSNEDQDIIYAKLRKWLGFNLEIYPMYNVED